MRDLLAVLTLVSFLVTGIIGPLPVYAQEYHLPAPGVMVHLSPPLDPPILKGIKVHTDNPFRFDFILDKGDGSGVIASEAKQSQQEQLTQEASKLIKYFLASLTIPEKDLWVNLSPYEKDRIIPNSFGLTEMGRDLLAEDYILKQITASLIYPEDEIGKKFWKRIYAEAAKRYGTTNIPINTFNKVWIIPEKAVVYENAKAGTAYVVESKLKVMLEQDYLSLAKHANVGARHAVPLQGKSINQLGSDIVRQLVIPELTKEVNENKNFARLRQVYNSLILATWYKKKIKESILSQVYEDKNKVAGVSINDPKEKEKIYRQYLRAFKKGVYNYIKEDIDPLTQETVPRKYFSGGVNYAMIGAQTANSLKVITDASQVIIDPSQADRAFLVESQADPTAVHARVNAAMNDTHWDENNLKGWFQMYVDKGNEVFDRIPQQRRAHLVGILNETGSNSQKKKQLAGIVSPELAIRLLRMERSALNWLDFNQPKISLLELTIEDQLKKQGMSLEEAQQHRREVEDQLGRVRGPNLAAGYGPLVTDQDLQRLMRVLVKQGLDFIFPDGINFAHSYPVSGSYTGYPISVVATNLANDDFSKIKLRSQIILVDVPTGEQARARYIHIINNDLYIPQLFNDNREAMEAGRRRFPALFAILDSCQRNFHERSLPPASEETAKKLLETLFFHEIGEMIYNTLSESYKEEWHALMTTPGSKPLPGIITFKNQLKMIGQNLIDFGAQVPEPEFFADYFAMYFYKENVYAAYGEEFRDGWGKFMEKVKRNLFQKHQQGRNVWEIEDSSHVRKVQEEGGYIKESDLPELSSAVSSRVTPAMHSKIKRSLNAGERVRRIAHWGAGNDNLNIPQKLINDMRQHPAVEGRNQAEKFRNALKNPLIDVDVGEAMGLVDPVRGVIALHPDADRFVALHEAVEGIVRNRLAERFLRKRGMREEQIELFLDDPAKMESLFRAHPELGKRAHQRAAAVEHRARKQYLGQFQDSLRRIAQMFFNDNHLNSELSPETVQGLIEELRNSKKLSWPSTLKKKEVFLKAVQRCLEGEMWGKVLSMKTISGLNPVAVFLSRLALLVIEKEKFGMNDELLRDHISPEFIFRNGPPSRMEAVAILEAAGLLNNDSPGEVLGSWLDAADQLGIDVPNMEANLILNLVVNWQQLGFKIGFESPLVLQLAREIPTKIQQHFFEGMMSFTESIGDILKMGIRVDKFLARGFDGMVFKAYFRGEPVVVKIQMIKDRQEPFLGADGQPRMHIVRAQQELIKKVQIIARISPIRSIHIANSVVKPVVVGKNIGQGVILVLVNQFIPGLSLKDQLMRLGDDNLKGTMSVVDRLMEVTEVLRAHRLVDEDIRNLGNIIDRNGRGVFIDNGNLRVIQDIKQEGPALNQKFVLAVIRALLGMVIKEVGDNAEDERELNYFFQEKFGEKYKVFGERLVKNIVACFHGRISLEEFIKQWKEIETEINRTEAAKLNHQPMPTHWGAHVGENNMAMRTGKITLESTLRFLESFPEIDLDNVREWLMESSDRKVVAFKLKILNNINRISLKEFDAVLKHTVIKANKLLNESTSSYAILFDDEAHKSRRWVFEKVMKLHGLTRKPAYTGYSTRKQIEKLARKNVRVILTFDDAAYSGGLNDFLGRNINDVYEELGMEPPRIIAVVPFVTRRAIRVGKLQGIEYLYGRIIRNMQDMFPEEMKRYANKDKRFTGEELKYQVNVTLTYLSFKKPDSISFLRRIRLLMKPRPQAPYRIKNTKYYRIETRDFRSRRISKVSKLPSEVRYESPVTGAKSPAMKTGQMRRGGIDLTPANMHLQTQNNGGGEIKFHINPVMLAQLQNAPGFTPKIISIKPMVDVSAFLGIKDYNKKIPAQDNMALH